MNFEYIQICRIGAQTDCGIFFLGEFPGSWKVKKKEKVGKAERQTSVEWKKVGIWRVI